MLQMYVSFYYFVSSTGTKVIYFLIKQEFNELFFADISKKRRFHLHLYG